MSVGPSIRRSVRPSQVIFRRVLDASCAVYSVLFTSCMSFLSIRSINPFPSPKKIRLFFIGNSNVIKRKQKKRCQWIDRQLFLYVFICFYLIRTISDIPFIFPYSNFRFNRSFVDGIMISLMVGCITANRTFIGQVVSEFSIFFSISR